MPPHRIHVDDGKCFFFGERKCARIAPTIVMMVATINVKNSDSAFFLFRFTVFRNSAMEKDCYISKHHYLSPDLMLPLAATPNTLSDDEPSDLSSNYSPNFSLNSSLDSDKEKLDKSRPYQSSQHSHRKCYDSSGADEIRFLRGIFQTRK